MLGRQVLFHVEAQQNLALADLAALWTPFNRIEESVITLYIYNKNASLLKRIGINVIRDVVHQAIFAIEFAFAANQIAGLIVCDPKVFE